MHNASMKVEVLESVENAASIQSTTVVLAGTFIIAYFIHAMVKPRSGKPMPTHLHKPPALKSLPVVGSLPYMPSYDTWYKFFLEKMQTHGKVFKFQMGGKQAVVISSRDAIYEALVKRAADFSDRPTYDSKSTLFNPEYRGYFDSLYTPKFKRFHKIGLNILKDLGFGSKNVMEQRIHRQVMTLLRVLNERKGEPFYPQKQVSSCVLNVVLSITFGRDYDIRDPKLQTITGVIHDIFANFRTVVITDFFWFLRYLPHYQRCFQKVSDLHDGIFGFCDEAIVDGMNQESFVTHFIKREGPEYDREELRFIVRDLLLAGTDSSATTLLWSMIFFANNPDIQEKLQKEVDSVVPRDRLPSSDDRPMLPYLEATILELFRIKTVVPLGATHYAANDTEVAGFFVPAGTLVITNLYGSHMDKDFWENPMTFNPDRFLDADGKIIHRERVIPFSLGKRSCLGERLAHQEVYLFLAALIQNYTMLPPEEQNVIEEVERVDITISPEPFQIRIVPRNQEINLS